MMVILGLSFIPTIQKNIFQLLAFEGDLVQQTELFEQQLFSSLLIIGILGVDKAIVTFTHFTSDNDNMPKVGRSTSSSFSPRDIESLISTSTKTPTPEKTFPTMPSRIYRVGVVMVLIASLRFSDNNVMSSIIFCTLETMVAFWILKTLLLSQEARAMVCSFVAAMGFGSKVPTKND